MRRHGRTEFLDPHTHSVGRPAPVPPHSHRARLIERIWSLRKHAMAFSPTQARAGGGPTPGARVRWMKLLVIGGTQFVGRAFVEEAARRGDEVTVFHRGASEAADLPDVDHVHGNRDG